MGPEKNLRQKVTEALAACIDNDNVESTSFRIEKKPIMVIFTGRETRKSTGRGDSINKADKDLKRATKPKPYSQCYERQACVLSGAKSC